MEARVLTDPPAGVPSVSLDPYADTSLQDPGGCANVWLGAGEAFWLASIGTWGVARYRDVRDVLADPDSFCSSAGGGIVDRLANPSPRPPSALLDADPPDHTASRGVISEVLTTMARKPQFEEWGRIADALVKRLVRAGSFDAVSELATPFGHAIVPQEIGIRDFRPDLSFLYGVVGGDSQYPFNDRYAASVSDSRLAEALRWVDASCERQNLTPGGWGAAVHDAARTRGFDGPHAELLVRSLVLAGVENTIRSVGSMVHLLARHPRQWAALRDDPSLCRNAVEESMRLEGAALQFFRTTTREVTVGTYNIPPRSKVLVLVAAANRDPRRWQDPHHFDVTRTASGQLGFGFGPHVCVGQAIARQQMIAVLRSLVTHARILRPAGDAIRSLNHTVRGFERVPVAVEAG
jgi:cytochrome P450